MQGSKLAPEKQSVPLDLAPAKEPAVRKPPKKRSYTAASQFKVPDDPEEAHKFFKQFVLRNCGHLAKTQCDCPNNDLPEGCY